MSKVSVVTGANKGIGFAIVRGLCKQVGGTVILTTRNEERGLEAVKKLKEEDLTATFEQLDITDVASVERFIEIIKTKHGGIDILCNNAGIAGGSTKSCTLFERAQKTLDTNFCSTVRLTESLLPLIRENGRICQVSSLAGLLSWVFPDENNPVRKRFLDPSLTKQELMSFYDDYMNEARHDKYAMFKINCSYSTSKCFLTAYTKVLGRQLLNNTNNIVVNACCPGYVITDMTAENTITPKLTVDEGAITPLFLCQLSSEFATNGEFYVERQVFDWNKLSTDPVYHCN